MRSQIDPDVGTKRLIVPFLKWLQRIGDSKMEDQVRELLMAQLKDAYSAEKQALGCMKKVQKKATTTELRDGISMHIDQSQAQIERVEKALEILGSKPGRKVCEAMRGLVEEANNELEEHDKGPVLDLVIVAGMQRIEHYEIAAYGTDIALAQALGEQEIVDLLQETLDEEKLTDTRLTEVTQQFVMPAAMGSVAEEQDNKRKTG
jgi:ferritin-like metal-binding protein YciE